MPVASGLLVGCLALMMLMGAFVVIYGLLGLARSGRTGPSGVSDFTIPWFGGKEIELKGPAWLLTVAIGALMTASPVLVVFAQKPTDITAPPITVERVQGDLPEENGASFRFFSDLSVLDLRRSHQTPWYSHLRLFENSEEAEKIKPAILRNVMTLEKVKDESKLILHYSTTGTLVVRCLTQRATYMETLVTGNGTSTDTWAVNVDVGAIPMNTKFEIIIEATYYNQFVGVEGSAYSTYANEQTDPEDLSVAIIFPDDKPMKGVSVMEYPPSHAPGAKFAGMAREFTDRKGLTYYWTTINTRSNYFYTLNWSW
jgi:hypothetical protein